MSVRLPSSARRLAALALAMCGLVAFVLAIQTAPAGAAALTGGPLPSEALVPQIINGQETTAAQYPWQVYIVAIEGEGKYGSCGGSILNSTTILTAAHCVDMEETATPYPASDLLVLAGASEVLLATFEAHPPSRQEGLVKSFRVDPYYVPLTKGGASTKDDVAVLTLEKELTLSSADLTAAIPLVPTGATPAAGTPLSVSGFGKESGAEGSQPNGKLYATSLTATSSAGCLDDAGANTAVFLCAESATSATCQGDSGGPLTEGSPAVQVGIVDLGPNGCPPGQPDLFTNIAAPEIRAFIEGSESPPIAARPTSPPIIKSVGAASVDFSPVTCEAGGWSGSPSYSYTFQAGSIAGAVLQSGASNVFTPPASLVGTPLVCVVQASNPGGVATNVSAPTAAITADTAAPTASITAPKCRLQACIVSISASDPNAVTLTLTSSVAYQVTAKCPVKKGKKKKKGKQPVCHKTLTVNLPVSVVSPGVYSAAATKLPYGEKITFTALATDAAGLHPAAAPVASTTLHKPAKPKPKKRKKKKKSKKH